mgnify:CR=1 FL=1
MLDALETPPVLGAGPSVSSDEVRCLGRAQVLAIRFVQVARLAGRYARSVLPGDEREADVGGDVQQDREIGLRDAEDPVFEVVQPREESPPLPLGR